MKATTLAFRFRVWIFLLLYLVGFLAPWEGSFAGRRSGTLWLAASTLLARTGWMSLSSSTLAVTIAALCCCVLGAVFRVWGTAYLGASTMLAPSMRADQIMVAGPYRYLRNPLYLGGSLLAAGVSVLMPASGAIVFLVSFCLFVLLLISGEERFLADTLGGVYQEYRRRVRRLLPGFRTGIPSSDARPHWFEGVLAEIYPVGFSLCFAVFAWRYDSQLLIRCLLICYGLALVARAFRARPAQGE